MSNFALENNTLALTTSKSTDLMNAKEMYEALLNHLANVSDDELARDWENLKQYNTGVSISEYIDSVQYVAEIVSTPVSFIDNELKDDTTFIKNDYSLAA